MSRRPGGPRPSIPPVRYVVMGPGGIGGVIGARLFAIGKEVALVARGSHLEALQRSGLRLVTPDAVEHYQIPTFGHVSELSISSDHMVVLAMKSQDTMGAIDSLASVAPAGVGLVCAQNGVDNERVALRRFSEVYAMCVVLPGGHFEPGVVVQWSSPCAGVLDVGRFPYMEDDRAREMAADLEAAGFRCEVDPNVMRKKYSKLLTNLLNALDALGGAEARYTTLARRIQEEGAAVLEAAG